MHPPLCFCQVWNKNGVNQSTLVSFPVLQVMEAGRGPGTRLSRVSLLFLATVMADPSAAAQFQPPPPPPTLPPILPSGAKKCAIPECPNACYVDPSGTVHGCCGYTHAMEHQRRQAVLQRMLITTSILQPSLSVVVSLVMLKLESICLPLLGRKDWTFSLLMCIRF